MDLIDHRKHRGVTEPTKPDVPEPMALGPALRALRRRADLSQRELAAKAGVPKSTVARIESAAADARFDTVERLVRAAGGLLVIGASGDLAAKAVARPAPVPHDEWRDEAGRRYPAHLDVWEVREPKDWPGAWWAEWYNLPPARWPRPMPLATYELNRVYRDRRRRTEWVRAAVVVRRVTDEGPATCWRFVAELPDGGLVGELRAHERSPHLQWGGDEQAWEREVVLDGVLVAAEHRRLGIGSRLVGAFTDQMTKTGIRVARAIAEHHGIDFLVSCGFRQDGARPVALRLDRGVSGGRRPPR